jgi:hypothetical protein
VSSQSPPSQAAIGATGASAGYYLNNPSNQYLGQSTSTQFTFSPVSDYEYVIENSGLLISALSGSNGYNGDGATAVYNQFLVRQQPDGTWVIVSPYLQNSGNSVCYLCILSTISGPYGPIFCSDPYSFTFTVVSSAASSSALGITSSRALKDSVSGQYININSNPYLSATRNNYTFTYVTGSTNSYSICLSGVCISAQQPWFSTAGPSQPYNQFQIQQQSNGKYAIFSPYQYQFNGCGWLTTQIPAVDYPPALYFSNKNNTGFWFLE